MTEPEEKHVTRRELSTELRAFRNEMRALLLLTLIVLKFDPPPELTLPAIAAVVAKAAWTAFSTRFLNH